MKKPGRSVLVGNGVNRLKVGVSWSDILMELAKSVGVPDVMKLYRHKPFALIYEEIFLNAGFPGKEDELKLKTAVAATINKLPPNDYHRRLMEAVPRHIITTNYDYNFERSLASSNIVANLRPESKYNVFRRRQVGKKFVWHVHGETEVPNSITLGYEHYSGQMQKLRDYTTANRNSKRKIKSPFKLSVLDFDNRPEPYFWIDVFLRDNIQIVGVNLDYTEMDLWWLLTCKERLRRRGFGVGTTTYHHVPSSDGDDKYIEARLSVLTSLGVEVVNHSRDEHAKAYDEVLKRLTAV